MHGKTIGYALTFLFCIFITGDPEAADYGYDYKHKIGTDYVFRTDRVISDQAGSQGGCDLYSALQRQRKILDSQQPGQETQAGLADVEREDLSFAVQSIVDQLLDVPDKEEIMDHVMVVSTFVNLNHLYKTSSLGRYLGEAVLGALQRAGVQILDVRKTPGVMISQGYGEYTLSRDMDELSYVHQADAVVVGTYIFAEERIYINARLLNGEDGLVLASAQVESPVGPIIQEFLADESIPLAPAKPVAVRELQE